MSTQATIAIENQSGTIESITIDYDGYLEHTGYISQHLILERKIYYAQIL